MIELVTSTTDSGLSVTIFRPVIPRKCSLLGFFISLHHTSLVLSSEFSSSLLSSSLVLVSMSLVTTMAEDHNCLRELVVGTSLSLSKLSLSLWSDTSERVSSMTEILQDNKRENIIREIFISWCVSEKKAAPSVSYYTAGYPLLLLFAAVSPHVFNTCNTTESPDSSGLTLPVSWNVNGY